MQRSKRSCQQPVALAVNTADSPHSARVAESVAFSIYWPPKSLWPNARPHWAARAKSVRQYREDAGHSALAVLSRRGKPRWERAVARVTWVVPDNRRRDLGTNGMAALKALWDGLVDAGVLLDDQHLTVEAGGVRVEKGKKRVEVEIRPA